MQLIGAILCTGTMQKELQALLNNYHIFRLFYTFSSYKNLHVLFISTFLQTNKQKLSYKKTRHSKEDESDQ